MTKAQINRIIKETAEKHGFDTTEEAGFQGFSEIKSEELNFIYDVRYTENTDWKNGIVELKLTVSASVRKMGGHPTIEELFNTAEEIDSGAQVLEELERIDLIWTEEIPRD